MKRIQPYTQRSDARGTLTGILNSGQWEEFNYLETQAGNTRGGHFHKETLEVFFILRGEIDIEIRHPDGSTLQEHVAGGDIFMIEPGEIHTFHCRTDTAWINVLSRRFDPDLPDMHMP